MSLTAIMAISDDNVIGTTGPNGPTLPWRLPPDLRRFKALTTGHAVIMGRTTFDSIGRALPNRKNVVITSRPCSIEGVTFCPTPEAALGHAYGHDPSPFVIGGAEIWSALWAHVTHVELTRVHTKVGLGRCFGFHTPLWRETACEPRQDFEGLGYTFVSFERIASDASLSEGARR